MTTEYLEHPFAAMFPSMSDMEFESLKQDIAENGLKEPIVLFEGKILDGRHRYRACKALEIEFKPTDFTPFDGSKEEAKQFSTSANLMRRHLSKSQKAMALVLADLVAPPATPGKRRARGTGRDSIMEIGRRYGVNHMTIYKAAFIADRDKELADAVLAGKFSVAVAEGKIRSLSDEVQKPKDSEYHRNLKKTVSQVGGGLRQLQKDLRTIPRDGSIDAKATQELRNLIKKVLSSLRSVLTDHR